MRGKVLYVYEESIACLYNDTWRALAEWYRGTIGNQAEALATDPAKVV
jgi:hypothetical protein